MLNQNAKPSEPSIVFAEDYIDTMERSRSAAVSRPLVLVAIVALIAAACGGGDSDSLTYKDPDRLTLFEIPATWNLYTTEDLSAVTEVPFVVQGRDFTLPVISRVAFEGSPSRNVSNLAQPISRLDFPVGSAVVRSIGPSMRDLVSRYLLTEVVVPYRQAPQSQEILKTDLQFADDWEGVQVVVQYTESATSEDAAVFMASITDPEQTRLFSIAVGCSVDCFNTYIEDIRGIVDSWLVNTNG